MALTERERAILDVERSWWAAPDSAFTKRTAIRRQVGVSTTRYYQLVSALLENPDADAYDPLVVRRLRRARDDRRRARYEGRRVEERSRR